jgi:hypothetical protein
MVKIKYRQCLPLIGNLKAQRCSKFNADNLENGITAQEYTTKAEDLLETLPDAKYQNVETAWESIKQAICKAAEYTLGYNIKKVRNGWYDEEHKEVPEVQNCDCLKMLRRKTRGNIQIYKDARKETRKVCRRKKTL